MTIAHVTVTTPPAAEPVTLLDVYRHLRLDYTSEGSPSEASHPLDDLLRKNITAARTDVEKETGLSLIVQTLRLSTSGFPGSCGGPARVELRRPPVIAVEGVYYYDGLNSLRQVDAADYYITDELVPELRFVTGFATPLTYDRPDALRVIYRAGHVGTGSPPSTQAELAANVPEPLKQAILIGVELLQGDADDKLRMALERQRASLLQPFRLEILA